jgi:hypothetical protein
MTRDKFEKIIEDINTADMVLIGLGEEFDCTREFRSEDSYEKGKKILLESGKGALLPAWQELFRKEELRGLMAVIHLLEGKNYFAVSVSTNARIMQMPWREGRLVMPCGTTLYKQCTSSCEKNLQVVTEPEREKVMGQLRKWRDSIRQNEDSELPEGLGICPVCGEKVEFNNIYSESYDENGYLPDWTHYTKWLQGTLNRNLVILELGVGMKFPSVIRFPFEKTAYLNQKAKFYRINENLYQMTEELTKKGTGIAENVIDWLQNLC